MRRRESSVEDIRSDIGRLWESVLGIAPESTDTFLDLGGGSLAAEEVIALSRTQLLVTLTAADFVGEPTLEQQARRLERRYREGFSTQNTSIQELRAGRGPSVFCLAGAGATVTWYLPLVPALDSPETVELAIYGLQAHGLQSRALPSWSVRRAARRHRRDIQSVQPQGPYVLVGHSYGGTVILEVAEQLRRAGQEVAAVVVLDTLIDAELALRNWSAEQEGFAEEVPASVLPRPLRLALDATRAATAGMIRRPPAGQRALFWSLGMRAQRKHQVGACTNTTVLLTDDARSQAPLWQQRLGAGSTIASVAGGHLTMIGEPEVHRATRVAIETGLAQISHRDAEAG